MKSLDELKFNVNVINKSGKSNIIGGSRAIFFLDENLNGIDDRGIHE